MKNKIDIIVNRERYLRTLEMIDEVLEIKVKNITELIFQKYIELGGAANVAEYLNEQGYRVEGAKDKRRYNSVDVTAIIDDKENNIIDKRLLFLVLELKKQHSYSNWQNRLLKISDDYNKKFRA